MTVPCPVAEELLLEARPVLADRLHVLVGAVLAVVLPVAHAPGVDAPEVAPALELPLAAVGRRPPVLLGATALHPVVQLGRAVSARAPGT